MKFINSFGKVFLLITLLWFSTPKESQAAPQTDRTWEYINVTALLSPNWAFVVMPGHRYEFKEDFPSRDNYKTFLWEFFAGPVFITKLTPQLTLKLPLWYYYMGFDLRNQTTGFKNAFGDYIYSHNIELLPIFEYKMDKFLFVSRTIFHNKIYDKNKLYDDASERKGFSMLIRQMFRINYNITPTFGVSIADELFYGVIEDRDAKILPSATSPVKGEPFYEKKGLSENRMYAGIFYKFNPFSVNLEYVLDRNYYSEKDGQVKDTNHYIMVVLNYVIKLY